MARIAGIERDNFKLFILDHRESHVEKCSTVYVDSIKIVLMYTNCHTVHTSKEFIHTKSTPNGIPHFFKPYSTLRQTRSSISSNWYQYQERIFLRKLICLYARFDLLTYTL